MGGVSRTKGTYIVETGCEKSREQIRERRRYEVRFAERSKANIIEEKNTRRATKRRVTSHGKERNNEYGGLWGPQRVTCVA